MSWVRVAKLVVKLIAATPALIDLGKAGAAAGRAIARGKGAPDRSDAADA